MVTLFFTQKRRAASGDLRNAAKVLQVSHLFIFFDLFDLMKVSTCIQNQEEEDHLREEEEEIPHDDGNEDDDDSLMRKKMQNIVDVGLVMDTIQ